MTDNTKPRPGRFETTVFESIDSTSNWLKGQGPVPWTAARATTQTAGRGRRGRTWTSDPGGLWISFAIPAGHSARFADCSPTAHHPLPTAHCPLPTAPSPGAFTLTAGLALLDSVEAAFPEIDGLGLKWPNDLVGPGPVKVGGILAEISTTFRQAAVPDGLLAECADFAVSGQTPVPVIIVGMGVNVANPPPEGLEFPAASLAALAQISAFDAARRIEPLALFLADALARAHEEYEKTGPEGFLERYSRRCVTIGSRVRVNGEYEAQAVGIAPDGGLLVERAGAVTRIISGEVTLSPAN